MLPDNPKTPWPPADFPAQRMGIRAAWYSGDMQQLANIYRGYFSNPFDGRAAFWGEQARGERRTLLHVPIAGDIASVAASLVFGEQPRITCETPQAQELLHRFIQDAEVFNTLIEAADSASGMGGVILKVDWDLRLANHPFLSIVQADSAVLDFTHGILTAATFWREVDSDGSDVLRLLERHEPGFVLTGLYRGTVEELGTQIPLESRTETAGMLPEVRTGISGLLCRYIPNMRPDRLDRGSNLGRADTDGSESLMDSLDEVYTSWIRDIRLGRGRIIVPEGFLDKTPGGGWFFDSGREAFAPVNAPIGPGDAGAQISIQQFAVRAAEHAATAQELVTRIVTAAGYSPQTFGLQVQGGTESGTALRLRENRTYQTTASKGNYWRVPLTDILEIMLQVASVHLNSGVAPERPNVEMQDGIIQPLTELAQSVALIAQAQAGSVETMVGMLHPDWTAEQVQTETGRILNERGLSVPDIPGLGIA